MDGISITDNKLFLSYQWIIEFSNISENLLKRWKARNIGERLYIDNRAYINYDTIPRPSREKLPSKEDIIEACEAYKKAKANPVVEINKEYCAGELRKAYAFGSVRYKDIYAAHGFDNKQTDAKARHHAVLERMYELHLSGEGKTSNLFLAYTKLYPDSYTQKSFNYVIRKLRNEGVESFTLPQYGNSAQNHLQFDDEYESFVLRYMSSGKAYSRIFIYDRLKEECQRLGRKTPSYTWVKDTFQKLMPTTFKERYGHSAHVSQKAPYAGIIKALYTHDQWQIDGWRLPFYMEKFKTLSVFAVMDAGSGYIIDYDIALTENTENILRGLETAVRKTHCLPFEMLSDNHSFNKTKEAEYLKKHTDDLGMTWNVDSNPRRKGIIERRLGVFGDKFLKQYPGYIGQGIRTKNPDGLTSPELIEKYTKAGTWRTEEEIRIYAHLAVEEYNKYVSKKTGKSPEQLYNRPEQPHKITVTDADIIRMFIRASEYTIRRGQINITRERHTYEYQLNSELYLKYNDKKVRVRYADFEEIYLFDLETDAFIDTVKHKSMIHGALANQTDADRELLNKNAGRLKGIESKRRKAQQEILSGDNLDASDRLDKRVHTKIDMEALVQDSKLCADLQKHGVDVSKILQPVVVDEDNTFKPEPKKKPVKSKKQNVVLKTFPTTNAGVNMHDMPQRTPQSPFTNPDVQIKKYVLKPK